MSSVLDVSFGLITLDGTCFGLRVRRERTLSVADRNMEVGVEKLEPERGFVEITDRPPDISLAEDSTKP